MKKSALIYSSLLNMSPKIYQYQDPVKQTTFFRGYFQTYAGSVVTKHSCPEVRTNKAQALKDAKKAIAKYKKTI